MNRGAIVGSGSSDRGPCGAPRSLLPIDRRSLVFAQSADFTASLSHAGLEFRAGVLQALRDFPRVRSRRLILLALDDGYDPERAVNNTRRFMEEEHVFALMGYLGTPTTQAILPLLTGSSLIMMCPFSGARGFRHPPQSNLINIRASYDDEVDAMARYFIDNSIHRISLFYQNDTYGLSGFRALELALSKQALSIYSYGSFERNSDNIDAGWLQMVEQQAWQHASRPPEVCTSANPRPPTISYWREPISSSIIN